MLFVYGTLDKDLLGYSYFTVQLVNLPTIALEHSVAVTLPLKNVSLAMHLNSRKDTT